MIVRLCDVAPDGSSTLVTRGCLNLARRAGMDRSVPALEAAETVEVAMSAIAWVFPPGHRMRLSVSDAYWPWVWPRPYGDEPVVLSPALSELILPVRDGDAPSEPVRFEEPEQAPPLGVIDSGPLHGHVGAGRAARMAASVAGARWRASRPPSVKCGISRTMMNGGSSSTPITRARAFFPTVCANPSVRLRHTRSVPVTRCPRRRHRSGTSR